MAGYKARILGSIYGHPYETEKERKLKTKPKIPVQYSAQIRFTISLDRIQDYRPSF